MNILFVCTGNTCRSPMAEWYFRHLCSEDRTLKTIRASSAGTGAIDGMPASQNALSALASFSIDASSHRSRRITSEIVSQSDLIIAMTNSHIRQLQSLFLKTASQTPLLLLSSFEGKNSDVFDPFGGGEQIYEECFFQIRTFVLQLYKHIKSSHSI